MNRDLSWRPVENRRRKRNTRLFILLLILIAANIGVVLYHGDPRQILPKSIQKKSATATSSIDTIQQNDELMGPPWPTASDWPGTLSAGLSQRVEELELKSGQTPASALAQIGVSEADIKGALDSVAAHIDFRRMRPGDELRARFDVSGRLALLDIARGALEQARTRRDGLVWNGQRIEITVDEVVRDVSGQVHTSLWDAIVSAGESPALVADLVNIFAYELDFYTEVQSGDSFRLLITKRYANGRFIEYGPIVAAEYSAGNTPHRAFLHRNNEQIIGYFDQAGNSLRKQLLKAPLQYANVTSRFGKRMHPILGYTRNHNGTDYGVPTGTPVWSVGDGRVVSAGWSSGFGRLVEVVHANGWLSQYAHLSQIKVKLGQHVSQKQIVGLVGATGLASGPHLHYGLKHHGKYVNSLAQKFERGQSLAGAELQGFRQEVARLTGELDRIRVAQEAARAKPEEG